MFIMTLWLLLAYSNCNNKKANAMIAVTLNNAIVFTLTSAFE